MKLGKYAIGSIFEELAERKRAERRCENEGHLGAREVGEDYRRWEMRMYCCRCGANFYRPLTSEESLEARRMLDAPMGV